MVWGKGEVRYGLGKGRGQIWSGERERLDMVWGKGEVRYDQGKGEIRYGQGKGEIRYGQGDQT